MSWVALGGAAVGVVGNMMSDSGDKNGGAGAQQQTRDPWAAAQPWLRSNIATGQNLQQQYQNTPFNESQLRAYGNMGAQSDYMRQVIPGLLGTASRQQLGFDRSNPNARPEAYKFDAAGSSGGLLGSLTGQALGNYGAANPPPPAPQQARGMGTFVQQEYDPMSVRHMQQFGGTTGGYGGLMDAGARGSKDGPLMFNGGYGDFKYGMDTPQPGTPAYRDMMEYFAYGGSDPYNIYGKGNQPQGLLGRQWEYGMGSADANSSGSATGAAASDGTGGGTAF